MSDQAQLQLINLKGEIRFYPLDSDKGVVNIGRHQDNDIIIDSPEVAPFQAILDHRQRPYHLIVLDQARPMKLNGQSLLPNITMLLENKSFIELAGYSLILLEEEEGPIDLPDGESLPLSPASPLPSPASPQVSESTATNTAYALTIGPLFPPRQIIAWPKDNARFVIRLTNTSNNHLTVHLAGNDPARKCQFEFTLPGETPALTGSATLDVSAQQSLSIPVSVTPPPRPLIGFNQRAHHFTLTVTNLSRRETPQAVLGQLKCRPLIGPGLITLIILCLIALLLPLYQLVSERFYASYQTTQTETERSDESESSALINKGVALKTNGEFRPARPVDMTYEEMFKEIGAAYNIDWQFLAALAYQESRLDPLAVGQAQEMGLMQILPATWNEWAPKVGVSDPFDPYSNVQVSAAYQVYLRDYFRAKGYSDQRWLLAAYNWGPDNLNQLLERKADWTEVPTITQRYAAKILKNAGRPILDLPELQQPINPLPTPATP